MDSEALFLIFSFFSVEINSLNIFNCVPFVIVDSRLESCLTTSKEEVDSLVSTVFSMKFFAVSAQLIIF
jgi:hypothetical protein